MLRNKGSNFDLGLTQLVQMDLNRQGLIQWILKSTGVFPLLPEGTGRCFSALLYPRSNEVSSCAAQQYQEYPVYENTDAK
ncbi:hypothetical protein AV530_003551 [Patagioenas fasciata monilis]|uniref:Uncharacterized protein n=1 Tax=Patagioenas fasciata monilis TaxID=372326 RepID=A0A1V4K4J8_PATFA|nr:hypothetical protein AV530_003551 [Patagioenas fasciata monilis]